MHFNAFRERPDVPGFQENNGRISFCPKMILFSFAQEVVHEGLIGMFGLYTCRGLVQ